MVSFADLVSTASFTSVEIVSDIFAEKWLRNRVVDLAVIVQIDTATSILLGLAIKTKIHKKGKFVFSKLTNPAQAFSGESQSYLPFSSIHGQGTSMLWKILYI